MTLEDQDWFDLQDFWEVFGHPDMEVNEIRYIGEDKPMVQRSKFSFSEPRDFGDNDKSDPEQNWDEEND